MIFGFNVSAKDFINSDSGFGGQICSLNGSQKINRDTL